MANPEVTINAVFEGLPNIIIGVMTFLVFWMVANYRGYWTGITEGEGLILLILTAYGFAFSVTKCIQGIVDILTYFGQMILRFIEKRHQPFDPPA